MIDPALRILCLGAGVQSSTIAMMAARGEFDVPDCAIFADTGWEPQAVYEWLGWLTEQLPFPVHLVKAKTPHQNIKKDVWESVRGQRFAGMPLFTTPSGMAKEKRRAQLRRQCTREYKITPIERGIRELLGLKPRQRVKKGVWVEQWFGISVDEVQRVKPPRTPWLKGRWPLVFELGWKRHDCLKWWRDLGLPEPPRSACIGCPYRTNREWRHLQDSAPPEFAEAVEFDQHIRQGVRGTTQECFLHPSLLPLPEAIEDDGQFDLWGEECEGMCGV